MSIMLNSGIIIRSINLSNNDINDEDLSIFWKVMCIAGNTEKKSLRIDRILLLIIFKIDNKNIKNKIYMLLHKIDFDEVDISFTSININKIININVPHLICRNNSVDNEVFEKLLGKNYYQSLDLSFNNISYCNYPFDICKCYLETLLLNCI